MNEEYLKNALLEIIKEADNLPENELEIIPGTRIRVKKGRVDEFKADARFYYQLKNNVAINNDDYIKNVYYELSDELAAELGEFALSKAYDLYQISKDELKRLEALNKSLHFNAQDQEKYKKALNDINNRNISDPKTWEEITNLQNSLKTLIDNETIIKNAIAEIKNKVNGEVKKAVLEEMEFLRNSYLNTRFGTSTSFGLDGASILASDKENYDNLYILLKIIENVNEKDPIICVNNILCVNPHQTDAVEELLPKIEFLSLVNKKTPEVVAKTREVIENKKPNDNLIAEISKELTRLKDKIFKENLPSDQLEYDNLIQILRYLNKANNSEFALTPIWDIAYINGIDRKPFIDLLKRTSFFKEKDPDINKIKENEELIIELKLYLTELENKVRNYQGLNNIPLAKVNDSIILLDDKQEYENVLAIINILSNSKESLINISGFGNISSNDIPKYKDLISKTKYFTPNIIAKKLDEQNGPIIKEVENELTALIKKAKSTPNAILAEGKEILESDLEEYNLLSQKYSILKNANSSSDLTEVNGALINIEEVDKYKKVLEDLEKINKRVEAKESPIIEGPTDLSEQTEDTFPKPTVEKPITEQEETFTPIDISESLLPVDNNKTLEDITPKKSEKTSVRKAVKAIRKAINKDWWKKNWKKVVGIGLSLALVAFSLSTLAPTIIYANSCLVMANPSLAGTLGTINNVLVNLAGVSMSSLNFNIAASNAFGATISALAKLGIIGGGITLSTKLLRQTDELRLPDPNKKNLISKIKEMASKALAKSKELGKNLSDKATTFTNNLAYATEGNNITAIQDLTNMKIEADANTLNHDEVSFDEIEASVQKEIEEEKRQMIEDRINERYNRIKHAEDAEYIRPTVLNDSPIIKNPELEAPTITVAIPTDKEILETFTDKSLELGRVDNYIDAIKEGNLSKAKEFQKLVFEDTGIDLSKYNMNDYGQLVQARSDVADFMNQVNITKRGGR